MIDPAVSEHMRINQRKSAHSRWSKLSKKQRSDLMRKVALARYHPDKPKS